MFSFKTLNNKKKVIFAFFLCSLSTSFYASNHLEKNTGLKVTKEAQLKEDIRLSHLLSDFFFSKEHHWTNAQNKLFTDEHHITHDQVHNAQLLTHLWETEISPLCEDFRKKHKKQNGVSFISLQKSIKSTDFNHDIFQQCVKFDNAIKEFHQHDDQANKLIPSLLAQLEKLLLESKETLSTTESVFNHSSKLHFQRRGLEMKIKLAKSWLDIEDGNTKLLNRHGKWKRKFKELTIAFSELHKKEKSISDQVDTLPTHVFQGDTHPMQKRIKLDLNRKFSIKPKQIIIRDYKVRHDLHRIIKNNDQMKLQKYSSLSFTAVMPISNKTVSTHYGWIELYKEGSSEVFIEKDHINFQKPTAEQIHTVGNRS